MLRRPHVRIDITDVDEGQPAINHSLYISLIMINRPMFGSLSRALIPRD